ncbi:hypothetical protein E4U54_008666 [Claviceps lovelessii]|nr:hypothetical protein E4U54_008666 [Claviceps lovelessii]
MALLRSALAAVAMTLLPLSHAWNIELPPCTQPFKPFVYSGCFQEGKDSNTLMFRSSLDTANMTVEKCMAECKGNGFRYAGLEYYGVCFCGATVDGAQVDESQCSFSCSGDKTQKCGGDKTLSIWQDPTFPNAEGITVDSYKSLGCYTDDSSKGRTLSYPMDLGAVACTPKTCLAACEKRGFPFAGIEYGKECYCGVVLANDTAKVDSSQCDFPCSDDPSIKCGGRSRMSLWIATDLWSLEPCVPPPPGLTTTIPSVMTTTTKPMETATTSSIDTTTTSSSISTTTKPVDTTTPWVDTTTKPADTTTSDCDTTSTSSQPITTTKPADTTTSDCDETTPASSQPVTTTGPADTTTQPAGTITKPSDTTTTTPWVDTTTKPADTTASDCDETTSASSQPVTTTTQPAGTTTDSAGTTTTSLVDTTTKPADTTTSDCDETTSASSQPVTTTKPADTTTQPAGTTTKPADTTTSDCDETTSASSQPVITTTQPAGTTTKPADTTTSDCDETTSASSQPVTTTKPADTTSLPAETTTQKPTTTTDHIPNTTTDLCTATVTVPAKCEWQCGNWCGPALPSWQDANGCHVAKKTCRKQISSCFKTAGWPGSLECFKFQAWCHHLDSYCEESCHGKACSKSECWNDYHKGGGSPPAIPPVTTTSVYDCATTSAPAPTTTKPAPTCPPEQMNFCTQPTNDKYGYGPGKPVGGIALPIVGCNDVKDDFYEKPYKFYREANSRDCPGFQWSRWPSVCSSACKEQYDHCVATYSKGCDTFGWRSEFHKRAEESRGELSKRNLGWGWGFGGWGSGSQGGSEHKTCAVAGGLIGSWLGLLGSDSVHCWGFGGNKPDWAPARCKAQYQDCIDANRWVKPKQTCSEWRGC